MRIGVDLGGTKIEVAALSDDGCIHVRERVATPAGDYPAILQTITELVSQIEDRLGARASVGVATPGAVSTLTNGIKNANSVCLNGKPLQQDLSERLQREVRIRNDADCFALSEALLGAGKHGKCIFGVILGTGVGGGIVVNGQLLSGPNHICGEWGHNPLPWMRGYEAPGPHCYCGKQGCIETYLSGPGLSADWKHVSGESRTAEEIVRLAQGGLSSAQACIERYCDRLARALASVINILDPDIIVLGGGMSNIASLYERVPAIWTDYVFSDQVHTLLLAAEQGDSSGVLGAAWLWPVRDEYEAQVERAP